MRIKAFCGVSVYTFHAGISARQRARGSVVGARCYKVQRCWTFTLYASERKPFSQSFTGVTNWVCSGSILQLRQRARTGQSARGVGVVKRTWSRSKCSRDPAGQTEVFVPVSLLQTFNLIYSYRQLAVWIVVSAIAVFWLVDDVIGAYLAVFRLFTDLITNSTRLQTQIVTPV